MCRLRNHFCEFVDNALLFVLVYADKGSAEHVLPHSLPSHCIAYIHNPTCLFWKSSIKIGVKGDAKPPPAVSPRPQRG